MRRLTHWIVKRFIKNYKRKYDVKVRAGYGYLEGWVSIIGNLLLFFIKIVIGISIGSISLIADAVHTLSDCVTSIVVILGFRFAKKPADKEHPFGHERMEPIATLIVSVLLFFAGTELMKRSIYSVVHPQQIVVSIYVIILIFFTALVKEVISRFSCELGEMIESTTLKADALHHRTDVVATLLVVIALIAARLGVSRVDGITGIIVSGIIFYSAYKIGKDAIDPLLGEPPSKEDIRKVEKLASRYKEVLGVHDIIFHRYGQMNIISLHIEVSDKEDLSKLHQVSEEIEEDISKEMNGMVVVHIDPINKDHPRYAEIFNAVTKIISEDRRVNSFHELRIVGKNRDKCNVIFDIALEADANEAEVYDIIRSIRIKFKAMFPHMNLAIKVEPKYVYNILSKNEKDTKN